MPGKGPGRPEQEQGCWYHWGWATPNGRPNLLRYCQSLGSATVAPSSGLLALLVHSYWPPFSVRDSCFQRPSLESLLNNIIREAAVSSVVRHTAVACLPAVAQQLPSSCPGQLPMAEWFEHNTDIIQRIQIHVLTYFFPMKADRSPFSAQEVRSVVLPQEVRSIVLHCFCPTSQHVSCNAVLCRPLPVAVCSTTKSL